MLKEISAATNKAQRIIAAYKDSVKQHGYRNIYNLYNKPSKKKVQAYNSAVAEAYNKRGYNLTVISGNKYAFSVGFEYDSKGKRYLAYITKKGSCSIEICQSLDKKNKVGYWF